MIPTINDILQDLMRGTLTYTQALAYIEQHLAAAREADENMRDVFAGLAMQGTIASAPNGRAPVCSTLADWSYEMADAMLEARNG